MQKYNTVVIIIIISYCICCTPVLRVELIALDMYDCSLRSMRIWAYMGPFG
jgi:hypothetical protein